MTVPGWGQVTPAQMYMVMLAGHVLHRHPVQPGTVEPDEARLRAMALGRARLRRLTGQDFGYDLRRWHEHLLADEDTGYSHPFAWDTVRPAIERALADSDRERLMALLERPPERLSSEGLAALIVDALVEAGIVERSAFGAALAVAREEIEVRKAMGDY
jgi:hypothetical protein